MSTVYPVVITSSTYANAAALTAQDATLLRNGSTGYVVGLGMFALNANSTATPDNITAIAATPNGNWVLQEFPYIMINGNNDFDFSQMPIFPFQVTASATALATAGKVNLITNNVNYQFQYQIVSLHANLVGTNFSGGSGNRLLAITDGTSVYSVIPAASIQTLANAGWGTTALPYPASVSISTPTVAGANLYLQYSGGTTDYTAGSVTISGLATILNG